MPHRIPRAGRWGLGAVLIAVVVGAMPGVARAADLHATPATFSSVFNSARAGDRILLASGSYGTFTGGMKSGIVTITPESGASASMALRFAPASNITIDGLHLTGSEMSGATTRNITVRNSTFDNAQAIFRTGSLQNANILFDHNTHIGFVKCTGCGEGRVWFPEKTSQPAGITIQNSYFADGDSDGIQTGGNGVRILDNEFTRIHQITGSSVHADSIQLYGSSNTVIRGNYFHDVADCIMAPDGTDHEVIEDNVCVTDGYPYAFTIESDNGSVVRHNTLAQFSTESAGGCEYNLPCGILRMGNKTGQPGGTGTTVQDNILAQVDVPDGTQSFAVENYNLSTHRKGSGASDLLGTPSFGGGAKPSAMSGFALMPGSVGTASASDGTNRGAPVSGDDTAPTPSPSPTPSPTPALGDILAQAMWNAPTDVVTGTPATLDGTASTGNPVIACTWTFEDETASTVFQTKTGCKVKMTFTSTGWKYVRLSVKDADGEMSSNRQTLDVSASPAKGKPDKTSPDTPAASAPATASAANPVAAPASSAPQSTATARDTSTDTTMESGRTVRLGGGHAAIAIPAAATNAHRPLTIEARVRTTARTPAQQVLVLGRGGRTLAFDLHRALRRRRWSHVAVTVVGGRATLFVDGVRSATRSGGAFLRTAKGPLALGGRRRGRGFNGQLDDLRVYDRALTARRITRDMRRPVSAH